MGKLIGSLKAKIKRYLREKELLDETQLWIARTKADLNAFMTLITMLEETATCEQEAARARRLLAQAEMMRHRLGQTAEAVSEKDCTRAMTMRAAAQRIRDDLAVKTGLPSA